MPTSTRNGDQQSPKVLRVQLGEELRQLREAAGIFSRKVVADGLGCDVTKVSRIESGQTSLVPEDLDFLLKLYGADEENAKRVREVGEAARRRGSYGKAPLWAKDYLDIVSDADAIKIYYGELVPGPLQTYAYARAVLSTSVTMAPMDVEPHAQNRAHQRSVLTSGNPPNIQIVLGEAVLRRQVGGPGVLRAQLEHIRDVAARANVVLQLLPFSSGEHAALETAFTLMYLFDSGKSYAYLEDLTNASLWQAKRHVSVYELTFDQLQSNALSSEATLEVLDQAISDIT